MTVLGVLAGLVWGFLAAVLNYHISKMSIEKKDNNLLLSVSFMRTVVDIAALGAIFLLRNVLPFDYTVVIISAAVAMSMGTIFFTFLLARRNKGSSDNE